MKYTTLKNDIISILHSSDYNLTLKLYDKDGNNNLDAELTKWIYIENKKIMIELADDEEPIIHIWKDQGDVSNDFEILIQRLRELSILNGVSVQIHLFNDLNRRRIYNLIKNSIENRKEEDMNESVSKTLSKTLYELSNIVHNTKRTSDLYISESLRAKNTYSFMNDIIASILCLESLHNSKIKSLLTKTLMEQNYKNIDNIVRVFEKKHPQEFSSLTENLSNIDNISQFMKQRYLNNIETKATPHTMLVLENVKVYPIKTKNDLTNLSKAYNHLLTVCEGAKTGTDILLAIKRNNICETYSVSKNDLLDIWLSKKINEKIKPTTLLVFENVNGETLSFNMDMKPSIRILAKHFNANGLVNDELTTNIVNETIKLNQLTDLIENYSYKLGVKKHASTLSKLYKQCLENLNENTFGQNLLESSNKMVDYSRELSILEAKIGFTHPSLKYIAIEHAIENKKHKASVLAEQKKDKIALKNGLLLSTTSNKSEDYASKIISGGIIAVKPIKECKCDRLSLTKSLLENIKSVDTEVENAIKESLFIIANNPARYNTLKDNFVKTIKKYIK